MVVDVNSTQVAPEERLSDHVYHFDAAAKTIKLADTTVEALGLSQLIVVTIMKQHRQIQRVIALVITDRRIL